MEPWAIAMVVSHSKGCCVIHHERTCVKSPVQSLVHGKCSVNRRNVDDEDEEEEEEDASLTSGLGFKLSTFGF